MGIGNKPGSGGGVPATTETIKVHRLTAVTTPTVDSFTSFDTLTVIEEESNGTALELLPDGKTVKCNKEGLYLFGGCVHFSNPSAGLFASTKVLSRLLINGTTEARCSQRDVTRDVGSAGSGVLSYIGTAYLKEDDEIELQYFTDQAGVDFISDSEFNNQVAATLWLIYQGAF